MTDTKARARILILYQDARAAQHLDSLLRAEEYEVQQAALTPADALYAAHQHAPDLILADVATPDPTTYAVLGHLKLDPVQHGVPMIVVSAFRDNASRIAALSVGAEEVV